MALLHSENFPLGWPAVDFSLPDTAGANHSLADFKSRGLLIAFTCNHCPYAIASWPLLIDLHKQFGEHVDFVAINSNDEKAYPEDSYEEMKKKVQEWEIPFLYLRDKTQEVARAYQAQCTPDLYLFKNNESTQSNNGNISNNFELFYHGRINDNWQKPDQVKEENLKDALERLISNQEPPIEQPPSMGCSIKWI